MVTDLRLNGRRVLLSHTPKAGGTSLRRLLGTKGMTHSMPEMVLTEQMWHDSVVIVPVRHPFDRFVSGYCYHVLGQYKGTLYRRHGSALKQLDVFTYLSFITQYPEKLGPLANWTDYPSATKPRADIVLRVEDSHGWVDQLTAAGLNLGSRQITRSNPSRPDGVTTDQVLGLAAKDFRQLRALVHAAYRQDYVDFGYDP